MLSPNALRASFLLATLSLPAYALVQAQEVRGVPAAAVSAELQQQQLQMKLMLQQLEPYRPIGEIKGAAVLCGSSTMHELGVNWSTRFKQFHPNVEFKGEVNGSEGALKLLAEDPTVIAGVSRPVDEIDQKNLKAGKCKQPLAIIVGLEAMALYVHQSNPMETITIEQLQLLFSAGPNGKSKASTWAQLSVNGPLANQPIRLYQRDPGSGSSTYIQRVLLGGASVATAIKTLASNSDICEEVAKDPAGVGLAGFEAGLTDSKRVDLIIGGQRIPTTEANLMNGKYPLIRPLTLVIDKAQLETDGGLRRAVMRYVLSKDGQLEVIKSGFIPVDPGFIRQQLDQVAGSQLR